MPKDIVSSEAPGKNNNPPSFFKRLINTLRTPFTKLALEKVQVSSFQMQSKTNVRVPALLESVDDGNGTGNLVKAVSNTQMSRETFSLNLTDGTTQNIEGFRLPPQPGKPTVVFFGGNNFDRENSDYRMAIRGMAEECRQKGLGFAVYDYPQGLDEQRMNDYVTGVQNHLVNQGVTMDLQAYSGYSMGSYPAVRAANTNQQSVGVHILSGFSSARMAAKEGMGKLGVLVDKSKLEVILDTAKEARELRTRLGPPSNGQMPISVTYSSIEEFGKTNNRHMAPVIHELGGNTAQGVKVTVNNTQNHLEMLNSQEQVRSFSSFVQDTDTHVNTLQQQQQLLLQPPPPQVALNNNNSQGVTAPLVQTTTDSSPGIDSRPRSSSVRESINKGEKEEQTQGIKRSLSTGDLSKVDTVKGNFKPIGKQPEEGGNKLKV
jgi:hypothetical protein